MNCTNLITLNLRINNFRGDLSAYNFSTLHNLHTIDLGNNNFTGSFPLTLTSCMFLTAIRLSRNKIEEQISPTILALVSLSYLSITNNNLSNITGAIRILMGCKNLRMLLLCKIFFHEAIPDENQITISSYAFQNLVVLGIGDCEIKGQIPTWLGKLKKLLVLDLGSNQITGPIPGWLGNMPNLFYIDLSYNSISGEFPKEFCGLPALALQEAKNRADGNQLQLPLFVPETKCALYNQQYNKLFSLPPAIYLRNNGLNGSIPIEIGNVMFLHVLDLSLINFSGEIPDPIFQLTKLEGLDFSENNLHGKIPLSLVDLHFLSSFSVANNDLQGQYHQERHNSCDFIHPRTDVWDWPNESSNNELHYGIIAGVVLDSSLDLLVGCFIPFIG
ncbi:hypothetical protein WN944_006330 [Citrus x changshan-huyou]|uniref:Uncharacterized protein n=1 Tax=Citrus x changshan-huyou TaxID=2935761 RepID=A0AAP0MNS4_9ROSI